MSVSFQENHPNPNEIFPLEGKLGSPTEGAKPIKLAGDLLAALAALAAALAALFFLYLSSTPLYIGTDTAQVEVEVFNREPGEVIFWTLVEGGPPDTLAPPEDRQELEEDQQTLTLTDLEPNTEYTIVFFTLDEDGKTLIRHTFTFITDGEGNPPPPPPVPPGDENGGQEPSGDGGNETSSTPSESSEPSAPTETTLATDPTNPPAPPGGGGGSSGTQQGSLIMNEVNNNNTITSQPNPIFGVIPVTITIGNYVPGDYEFRIIEVLMETDSRILTEQDYRNLQWDTSGNTIVGTFDLILDPAWVQNDYIPLRVAITGANYDADGNQVGEPSSTFVQGQVNLRQGYDVQITSPVGQTVNGLTCVQMELATDTTWGQSLIGVVPGQKVYVSLILEGSANKDFILTADYPNTVGLTPDPGYGSQQITAGDTYAGLYYSFLMPERSVTGEDLSFTLREEGLITNSLSQPAPEMAPGAPALPEAAGPGSVGPLTITQEAAGLRCTQATFHTASQPSAASLAEVTPGETVYLEILLEGTALRSFDLSAAFIPSARIQNLQILNQDTVSILDTDAYLRIAFTMPDGPVTAADIGFRGFIINE